jgi:hypothetical protein
MMRWSYWQLVQEWRDLKKKKDFMKRRISELAETEKEFEKLRDCHEQTAKQYSTAVSFLTAFSYEVELGCTQFKGLEELYTIIRLRV